MRFDEYRALDATALAECVQRGEVSAEELLTLAQQRAEQVDPQLNGLILPLPELARQTLTRLPEAAPLRGVPFLVKDLGQEIGGAPHYMGNRALRDADWREPRNSVLVDRWLQAGLVIFGRTSTPEFGSKGVTEPRIWGACRNPWNPAHTPGGSSGGSAALVAAGVVPAAGANDGGGSIRIPASHCGLFGFKPGVGRTPAGPTFNGRFNQLVVDHVVTRSVRDSARLLDASHGHEPGGGVRLAPPERPYAEDVQRDPGSLRIAFSTRSPLDTPVHAEAVQAVLDTVALLQSLGHQVEEDEPVLDSMMMTQDWLSIWFGLCAASVDQVKEGTGCGDRGFEPDTVVMAAFGRAQRSHELVRSLKRVPLYQLAMSTFLQQYDLWLTPTVAMPPARIGELDTPVWQQAAASLLVKAGAGRAVLRSGLLEKMARENLRYTPFTQLSNMTGGPAMSVPLHWTPDGLPLGVQFIGDHGDEGKLFRLAGQLEQVRPWFERVPA